MAIKFHPQPGTIVLCDYGGFKAPEMVKRRPAVIISPRLRRRDDLCTVVPLSSREPSPVEQHHYILKLDRPLPSPWGAPYYWVKADMLGTVAFRRLSLIGIGRDEDGRRKYLTKQIEPDDLRRIRMCVLHALGLSGLTAHL